VKLDAHAQFLLAQLRPRAERCRTFRRLRSLSQADAEWLYEEVEQRIRRAGYLPKSVEVNDFVNDVGRERWPELFRDDAVPTERQWQAVLQAAELWKMQRKTLPVNAAILDGIIDFFTQFAAGEAPAWSKKTHTEVRHDRKVHRLSYYLQHVYLKRKANVDWLKSLAGVKTADDVLTNAYEAIRIVLCQLYKEGNQIALNVVDMMQRRAPKDGKNLCEGKYAEQR
jgi:hypothetical protein